MPSTSDHANELDTAWAAGFLEGEGFFQKGRWVIGANQVNREPLERLQSLFGGKLSHRNQDPKVRRSWWGWEITGKENVLNLTRAILPWLSEDRKNRIPWLGLVQDQLEPRHVTEEYDPRSRFGLYRLCDCTRCEGKGKIGFTLQAGERGAAVKCPDCRGEGRVRQEVASCDSPEAVGVALVTLAREGEWEECPFGLLDREGEKEKKWLVLPWLPSPRNVSDAGRVLSSARKKYHTQ